MRSFLLPRLVAAGCLLLTILSLLIILSPPRKCGERKSGAKP